MIDYGTFKSLQALLFFGAAFAFCFWQLAAIKRTRRQRMQSIRIDRPSRAAPSSGAPSGRRPRLGRHPR
jgi:hypothetical protein